MGIISKITKPFGAGADSDERQERVPTQKCESCGEEYYTDEEIRSCRGCGGIKFEKVEQ